jgi:hypothetical protein
MVFRKFRVSWVGTLPSVLCAKKTDRIAVDFLHEARWEDFAGEFLSAGGAAEISRWWSEAEPPVE